MIKKQKIWLAVVVFICLVFFMPSIGIKADTINPLNNLDIFTYSFHLYYDRGQLLVDRDSKVKYDLIAEQFTPEILRTSTPYIGKIINVLNKTEAIFKFDPKQGKTNFVAGKITVKGPYFADAAKVDFYDAKNKLLLSIDVSGSSFCNDNNACEASVGENYLNCPIDCKVPAVIIPPTASGGLFSKPIILVSLFVAVIIVVLAIWFIIKRRWKTEIPPTIQ